MIGYKVKVTRLDTGESWPSIQEAAEGLFLSETTIYKARRKDGIAFGIPLKFEETKVKAGKVRVRCLETGEVFESQTEAAKSIGVHPASISIAVQKGYQAAGTHWEAA